MQNNRKTLKVTIFGKFVSKTYYLKFDKDHYELDFGIINKKPSKIKVKRILNKIYLDEFVHIQFLYPNGAIYGLNGNIKNIESNSFEIIGAKQK